MDRTTDGQTKWFQYPPCLYGGGGGRNKKKNKKRESKVGDWLKWFTKFQKDRWLENDHPGTNFVICLTPSNHIMMHLFTFHNVLQWKFADSRNTNTHQKHFLPNNFYLTCINLDWLEHNTLVLSWQVSESIFDTNTFNNPGHFSDILHNSSFPTILLWYSFSFAVDTLRMFCVHPVLLKKATACHVSAIWEMTIHKHA